MVGDFVWEHEGPSSQIDTVNDLTRLVQLSIEQHERMESTYNKQTFLLAEDRATDYYYYYDDADKAFTKAATDANTPNTMIYG